MGDMTAGWYDEGESGPPTMEDWEWYVAHVMVVQDRPPAVNRQPAPMEGQMTLVRPHSWRGPKGITTPREIRCADCGLVTDPAFMSRYDAEGCEPFELS